MTSSQVTSSAKIDFCQK